MAHDVFLSHSEKDKAIADTVVARLEAESVSCWVAPRDVVPGADWGESIINAIESSRIMILIFSKSANVSPQIKREVERAVNKGVYIIPFRVDDIPPARSLEYFISTSQWMDAFSPPLERHLDALVKTVKSVLKSSPVADANVPAPEERPIPGPPTPAVSWHKSIFIPVVIACLLVVGSTGWYLAHRRESLPVTPTGTPTPVLTPPATVTATPILTPALITPTSPPASNIIDDEEVRRFVTDHYDATKRRNVEDIVSGYDNLVDYLDYGQRDKAFIRNDTVAYFRRWPITWFSFTTGDIAVAHFALPNKVTAYFEIQFLVRDPASGRSNSGRARQEWVISKKSGALKIISQKETVYSD